MKFTVKMMILCISVYAIITSIYLSNQSTYKEDQLQIIREWGE